PCPWLASSLVKSKGTPVAPAPLPKSPLEAYNTRSGRACPALVAARSSVAAQRWRTCPMHGIFAPVPQRRTPYGSATYCPLETLGHHVQASTEFDPVPSRAYNSLASHLGMSHSLLKGA